jgi:hypothetical protein
LPYYFRKVDLPGEGPVLLGQRGGTLDRPFVGSIFRVKRSGTEITSGADLSLPANINLLSFLPLSKDLFVRISMSSLSVSNSSADLWQGDQLNGASELYINFKDPNSRGQNDTLPYFLAPRLLSGGDNIVLATEHKGGFLSHENQKFSQGRVVALQWNGDSLQELWHTRPQSGYLADFRLADADNDGQKELVAYFTFGRGGLFSLSSARSSVLIFELNQ